MEHNLRRINASWIFIGKRMVNDYWIVWVFGIQNYFMIVKPFRISIGKRMIINDFLIVSVFWI